MSNVPPYQWFYLDPPRPCQCGPCVAAAEARAARAVWPLTGEPVQDPHLARILAAQATEASERLIPERLLELAQWGERLMAQEHDLATRERDYARRNRPPLPDAHPYPQYYGELGPTCWEWGRHMPWWSVLLLPVAAVVAVVLACAWGLAMVVKAARRPRPQMSEGGYDC